MKVFLRMTIAAAVLAVGGRSALGCADGVVAPPSSAGPTPDVSDGSSGERDGGPDDDAASAPPTCSADGWCYTKLPSPASFDAGGIVPDPSGVRFALSSVWVSSDRRAWAVSRAGHVLRWDGTEWKVVFVAGAALRSVWGASATDIWIAGDSGTLLHGTGSEENLTFVPVSIGSTQAIERVWGTSRTDIWLVTDRAYHLTAETAGTATPFVEVPIPSDYGEDAAFVRPTTVWGTAEETWFAGTEGSLCAPPSCSNETRLFAARRRASGSSGAASWDTVPMAIPDATKVVGGTATSAGVQVLAIATRLYDTAFAARIADDASKLDAARGAVTVAGSHAWSFEVAQTFGQPTGIWGRDANDVILVGEWGVVRRFDGSGWQIVRVARTAVSPLVNHLRAIDGVVDPAGPRETWIVGEDVALYRRAP
jgi:hypothetical protein